MARERRDDARAVVAAVAIVAADMAARYLVYRRFPWEDGSDVWLVRDALMLVPMLASCVGCALAFNYCGGWARRGWRARLESIPALLLMLLIASFVLDWISRPGGLYLTGRQLAAGWLAVIASVFFEEAAFRGLIFTSLRGRLGPLWAAVGSSAFFVVFHVQVVDLSTQWPILLLTGLTMCAALEAGAGLPWLIAAHALIDGLWMHLGGYSFVARPWLHGAGTASAVLCGAASTVLLIRRHCAEARMPALKPKHPGATLSA